jgi:hypothetical protein
MGSASAAAPAVSDAATTAWSFSSPGNSAAPRAEASVSFLRTELTDIESQIDVLRCVQSIVEGDFESIESSDSAAAETSESASSSDDDDTELLAGELDAVETMMKLKLRINELLAVAKDTSASASRRAKARKKVRAKQARVQRYMASLEPLNGGRMQIGADASSPCRRGGPLMRFALFCAFVATVVATLGALGFIARRALAESDHHYHAAAHGGGAVRHKRSGRAGARMKHAQQSEDADAWRREALGELSPFSAASGSAAAGARAPRHRAGGSNPSGAR